MCNVAFVVIKQLFLDTSHIIVILINATYEIIIDLAQSFKE
jgi:hypothetical protein